MDPEKPFKTIEVIDSRTSKVCKIACMSCIRGHRTTSCGNPVCRSKILWTIKRPGRPANTCTCPYGRSGRCQCVVAQSACPHRPKKGEKRSVDCRCDEQGRWCCLLGPAQWDALMGLQRPRVDFYPTPEAMNAASAMSTNPPAPSFTPPYSMATPQTMLSLPSTPVPSNSVNNIGHGQSHPNGYQTPAYPASPFDVMANGISMQNDGHLNGNDLSWQHDSLLALQHDHHSYSDMTSPQSTPFSNSVMMSTAPTTPSHGLDHSAAELDFDAMAAPFEHITSTSVEPSDLMGLDKSIPDYLTWQFPSVICQSCGLSGCTCRSCPAVMQNVNDGSWAQCCSRKHVQAADAANIPALPSQPQVTNDGVLMGVDGFGMDSLKFGGDQPFPTDGVDFGGPAEADLVDFNQFVVTDPEPPSRGCCCGGNR